MAVAESSQDTDKLRKKLAATNHLLEQNIRALEEAQALTHLGSWRWDVATGEVNWSDELYRIYGLTPQARKIGFEEFLELIYVDDRERIGAIIGTAFKSGKPFDFEHRIVLPNQQTRVLYGKGTAVVDQTGAVVRMVGTSQDITERKMANEALFLSDERFKAVTAATNDVVYDIDLAAAKTWFNDSLATEYGYSALAARPRTWFFDHIHPEDVIRTEASLERALAGTAVNWSRDYRFRRQDGSYVDVRDRAYIIRDGDKKASRIIGTILDISQQKELGRAKDKFISLVSHQLRTPLTAMRLHIEMLADGRGGELTQTGQGFVDKIETSTVRMIKLVGDILNVSQIERGHLKVIPVPTDVAALIAWHVDEAQPAAAAKYATLRFKPADDLSEVMVDPILFSQIIHNLLSNAIRYTASKNTEIIVTFKKTDTNYELTFQDEGIGIPKAAQRNIFTSFFRADNAVKMHGEGTGLGLYYIKLIMDATGGKTWFTSVDGKGTTFYVTLPLNGMEAVDQCTSMLAEPHA